MTASITIENLRKSFRRQGGGEVRAVDDVSLTVNKGEFLVLLGPSGCGKTTLLRCIAGLEVPTSGRIGTENTVLFDSANRRNVPVDKRRIGMVFQSYALWPHKTVFMNVAYPLEARGLAKREVKERVTRVLEAMRIPELADQYPGQISGGQQQRVALARAIMAGREIILFDEPLSNIDARVRLDLRAEILAMQQEVGFTAVYVTHDQEEAMALASRIAVLDSGQVVQLGSAQDVYHRPETHYVARFVGSINEVVGVVREIDGDDALLKTPLGKLRVRNHRHTTVGTEMIAVSRPERWRIDFEEPTIDNRWKARIEQVRFVGSRTEYLADLGGEKVDVWTFSPEVVGEGADVWLSIPADGLSLLDPAR